MENSLDIAKKLIGAKYKLWLGDFQKTDDTPEPFYINVIPNIEYVIIIFYLKNLKVFKVFTR